MNVKAFNVQVLTSIEKSSKSVALGIIGDSVGISANVDALSRSTHQTNEGPSINLRRLAVYVSDGVIDPSVSLRQPFLTKVILTGPPPPLFHLNLAI